MTHVNVGTDRQLSVLNTVSVAIMGDIGYVVGLPMGDLQFTLISKEKSSICRNINTFTLYFVKKSSNILLFKMTNCDSKSKSCKSAFIIRQCMKQAIMPMFRPLHILC